MEFKKALEESDTREVREPSDIDYLLAMSGWMSESAVRELPWWYWAVCAAVLAIAMLTIFSFS